MKIIIIDDETLARSIVKEYLQRHPQLELVAECGDGFEGLPTFAPFDKVLVTAAAPQIPEKLLQQLKFGGMMVIPVNEGELQRMLRITKMADGRFAEERFDLFSFVPMLGGKMNNKY